MGPLRKPIDRGGFDDTETAGSSSSAGPDAPGRAGQDWESLEGAAPAPEIEPGDGDADDGIESAVRPGVEEDGDLPEEDDDNPDQESDEALPDDDEEHAIRRDMSGRGVRYEPD